MSHTSFAEAWQERRLHHTVVERLGNAVIIPQGLVVNVLQSALQLPDLNTTDKRRNLWHNILTFLKKWWQCVSIYDRMVESFTFSLAVKLQTFFPQNVSVFWERPSFLLHLVVWDSDGCIKHSPEDAFVAGWSGEGALVSEEVVEVLREHGAHIQVRYVHGLTCQDKIE